MGVYIKGMEMPTSCPCKLIGVGYDLYCSFTSGIPSRMREYRECCEKETRPNWCPIADVPTPHGRLIDADLLGKILKERAEDEWNKKTAPFSWSYAYECLIDTLDIMPTIIEAEADNA